MLHYPYPLPLPLCASRDLHPRPLPVDYSLRCFSLESNEIAAECHPYLPVQPHPPPNLQEASEVLLRVEEGQSQAESVLASVLVFVLVLVLFLVLILVLVVVLLADCRA